MLECPRCHQMGYEIGASFHWCGDGDKQCACCGLDWPSDRCPKCYKLGYRKGMAFSFVEGKDCPKCGRPLSEQQKMVLERAEDQSMPIQKIKLPYPYPDKHRLAYIEAWSESPGCLIVKLPPEQPNGDPKFLQLSQDETKQLLGRLGLGYENIPGYKAPPKPKPKKKKKIESVQHVTLEEWESFQRWRDAREEINDLSDDNLSNFKELLRMMTAAYPEFDEDFDDLLEGLRKMPRMLRYVKTGNYPPMHMDDEDISYYDESHNFDRAFAYHEDARKKQKLIVEVHIEDISDGKL